MRLPQRVRGIILGLITLAVGPVLAAFVVASGTPTVASAPPAAKAFTAVLTSNVEGPRIPELTEHNDQTPTPAATLRARATAVPIVEQTPVPKPAVAPAYVPVSYPPGTVEAIISAAAKKNGVNAQWMIRIASCESGERPNAVSSNGLYYGLFQFLPSTFKAHGGTNIFSAEQQASITAFMLAHGGARSWPVCSQR